MIPRREFLQLGALLGIATWTAGCSSAPPLPETAESAAGSSVQRVLIIGAGAAGLTAGHLLRQRGIDFTILEAATTHGGRMKTKLDFADFPLPLGAEWVHTDPGVFERIVNDESAAVSINATPYAAREPAARYDGDTVHFEETTDSDLKIAGDTWLTFFDRYVTPGVESSIQLDTPVTSIDYTDPQVKVSTARGDGHVADAVIVTVPLQQLKNRAISFTPPLPAAQQEAIDDAYVWGGMKVFIEFSEKWYPTFIEIDGAYSADGQKLYYDASFGQDSQQHVLGLFTVGDQSVPYQSRSGDDLLAYVLAELDEMFDGAASRTYVKHLAHDWNSEPFIEQAYLADGANWRHPPAIRRPLQRRVYFAGDAYTDGEDWSAVHMAAVSANEAVTNLLT